MAQNVQEMREFGLALVYQLTQDDFRVRQDCDADFFGAVFGYGGDDAVVAPFYICILNLLFWVCDFALSRFGCRPDMDFIFAQIFLTLFQLLHLGSSK